ncbi:MAG: hypothetical protein JW782_02220 [Candidatus Saganbacteria bacterium]|nr:hypothetical protein [Candidatus Saganbacteria bacterium]
MNVARTGRVFLFCRNQLFLREPGSRNWTRLQGSLASGVSRPALQTGIGLSKICDFLARELLAGKEVSYRAGMIITTDARGARLDMSARTLVTLPWDGEIKAQVALSDRGAGSDYAIDARRTAHKLLSFAAEGATLKLENGELVRWVTLLTGQDGVNSKVIIPCPGILTDHLVWLRPFLKTED